MGCNIWFQLCFGAFFLSNMRRTGGNDPFQGNFPKLNCLKPRLMTGCNGTLWNDYEQSNFSESDGNINDADTSLFLFTRLNRKCPEFLHKCDKLPDNTNFNPNEKTIIIVGGYSSGVCVYAYFREYVYQLLFRSNYNVILVDWSWGHFPDIYSTFVNARVVAKQLAYFIATRLMTVVKAASIHLIGHSIGAHIMGQAGHHVIVLTGEMVGRITGLDPANAAYTKAEKHENYDEIVDRSDAYRVDIIHTNAGKCFPKTIGIYEATGHADFYVNGGTYQKSCLQNIINGYQKCDVIRATASLFIPLCFHFMSVDYWKESINPCGCQFIGRECESVEAARLGKCSRSCGEDGSRCAIMGMDWEYCPHKNGSGIYYVHTNADCPYCVRNSVELQGYQCDKLNSSLCFYPEKNSTNEICTKYT